MRILVTANLLYCSVMLLYSYHNARNFSWWLIGVSIINVIVCGRNPINYSALGNSNPASAVSVTSSHRPCSGPLLTTDDDLPKGSCASYVGRFRTHSIVVLKLFFLTVLESGAPLSSSGLEEAL